MDRARIKTFVLLLLLAANVTFLSFIVVDTMQTARMQSEARAELVATLAGMGIVIDYEQIPDSEAQMLYFITRDFLVEGRVAAAILGGSATVYDEGGGIFRFRSQEGLGEGHIHAGAFRFFHLEAQDLDRDDTGELLSLLELQAREPVMIEDGASMWLAYPLTLNGFPLINGRAVFLFVDGILEDISGTALWGDLSAYAGRPQVDVTTALISLAGHLRERSDVSRFETVEMGYDLVDGVGILELRPIWIVETDGGTFTVDRQNGDIR